MSARPALPAPAPSDDLRRHLPAIEPDRTVSDWGRSERVEGLRRPDAATTFLYHYWFRCEVEGIEHVPATGGALLVANHAGALPPDASMIAKAIKEEHPRPRPLHLTVEHFFKGYPFLSMFVTKIGGVPGPSGQRPPPAARRAAARARLPGGRQGDGEALQGPLQAAPLRARRLRGGRRAGGRADRARRRDGRGGGDADLRPRRPAQAAHRAHLLPRHAAVPALRAARGRLPAGQVPHPLPAAGAHGPAGRRDAGGPRPAAGDRRRDPRADPGRGGRHGRRAGAPCGSDERRAASSSPASRPSGAAGSPRRSSATRRSRRSSA